MAAILGISAFYHDSAAALVVDGEIVAAAQEERFSRVKHDASFPHRAIEYCLQEAGLSSEDLDHVAYYEKSFQKFERILETHLAFAPRGVGSFLQSMPVWLKRKLRLSREIQKGLNGKYRKRIIYPPHHLSHAASSFFPSPFEQAAIVTIDGVGEWATTTIGCGTGNTIELKQEMEFPHSLGLLYAAFTAFCGFRVNGGEGKLMGLAPYGEPVYADRIREKLIDIKPDGSFLLDMEYFDFAVGKTMVSDKFGKLFEGSARIPETEIGPFQMNLAASIQQVTEEIILKLAAHARSLTGLDQLCLAGGVALNCVANGKLIESNLFRDVWIQPAAGDAGAALGAAQLVWYQLLNNPRTPQPGASIKGSLLGPQFDISSIGGFLDRQGVAYEVVEHESELVDRVATELAAGKIVGWFQGRMEFGPRALGNRSILADPRLPSMQSDLNRKTKFREDFRPFAPSVLAHRCPEYFELDLPDPASATEYMLMTARIHPQQRNSLAETEQKGLARLNRQQSSLPAVTHVDGSARVHTVNEQQNPRFFRLLQSFERLTGCPVLVNTSFNVRGEPLVCTPEDAYRCFSKSHIDVLVMDRLMIVKHAGEERSLPRTENENRNKRARIPTNRELRWFVCGQSVALAVVLGLAYFRFGVPGKWVLSGAVVASLAAILLMVFPRWGHPVQIAWNKIASAISVGLTRVLLTLVFYLLLSPMGIVGRFLGWEPARRFRRSETKTNWKIRNEKMDSIHFFRQY